MLGRQPMPVRSAFAAACPTGDGHALHEDHARPYRARLRITARRVDSGCKRALDIAASTLFLFVLAPVIALIAAAIKLDSRGPIFYRAYRVGRNGADLRVLKFRKMRLDAAGPALTVDGDERFTRIGKFLTEHRLDELPQLWNVLVGDMSLVGPRPEDPRFVDLHRDQFRYEILRLRPGITGLSQLAFAKEKDILDAAETERDYRERILPQKVAIDCLYVQERSVWMDVRILVWTTVAVLLRRDVAVHRHTGRLSLRRRSRAYATVAQPTDSPALSGSAAR